MPTYDYFCPLCKNKEEHHHKMNDFLQKLCPRCLSEGKESEMKKGFSAGLGLHFKGSGFYETDYKSKTIC